MREKLNGTPPETTRETRTINLRGIAAESHERYRRRAEEMGMTLKDFAVYAMDEATFTSGNSIRPLIKAALSDFDYEPLVNTIVARMESKRTT